VKLPDGKRTLDQNDKMWPMLRDIARQVEWRVNGHRTFMQPEEWKDVITAWVRKNLRLADGIDGGMVLLGERTSKMKTHEVAELIEAMYAFGADHGVKWTEE
jgi:hypothetical protein